MRCEDATQSGPISCGANNLRNTSEMPASLCSDRYDSVHRLRYERLPSMNMFEYIMHKDSYYSFEREVRAVAFAPAAELADNSFYENMFVLETVPDFRVCAPTVNLQQLIHGVFCIQMQDSTSNVRLISCALKVGCPALRFRVGIVSRSSEVGVLNRGRPNGGQMKIVTMNLLRHAPRSRLWAGI